MWSSRALTSLQKTYDEAYLTCSTAVYYESQSNESEAMRCWRNALDQIEQNAAFRQYEASGARTETERALVDSIKQLEIQCKERIDLLEALRISREEDGPFNASVSESLTAATTSADTSMAERGWIGDGTIPAITYPELSRPALPPRPSITSRTSSEHAVVGSRSGSLDLGSSSSPRPAQLPSYGPTTAAKKKPSRTPSPDKHTMRTTLRAGRGDRPTKLTRRPVPKATEGPSKAATLAWSSMSSRENLSRNQFGEGTGSASSLLEPRRSTDNPQRAAANTAQTRWDTHTRRLVATSAASESMSTAKGSSTPDLPMRSSGEYPFPANSALAVGAASSAIGSLSPVERRTHSPVATRTDSPRKTRSAQDSPRVSVLGSDYPSERRSTDMSPRSNQATTSIQEPNSARKRGMPQRRTRKPQEELQNSDEEATVTGSASRKGEESQTEAPIMADLSINDSAESTDDEEKKARNEWEKRKKKILKHLPPGVDDAAAKAIFNEIVVEGDEVHWNDVAGLEIAKNALREAVVYPFLRPDLFMGLREPARGMLLFGPPGTGKTMLARAVATESKSTFFSISASSLTSKYLGESEKLVRALFSLAKAMAPSIIFVDEIDSLLSQRSGSGEHEATRRIKTEFLIQWSDLQRAAAGRESSAAEKERGDATRVLVLAATNLPWAIDEAARRRFVRRQYIPLPEPTTRATQIKHLLGQQKQNLTDADIATLVELTDGFSGSDITALAKDAAMGPLRSLGEALLSTTMDQIRPIELSDFQASLETIRPSVGKEGLREYEDWARQFGERGG